MERREQVVGERVRVPRDRPDEPPVPGVVLAERFARRLDRALEQRRRPVVEGMRERGRRLDPLDAARSEWDRPEERRHQRERVDRRADVVDEAGERELSRARAAADRLPRLEHAHRDAGTGQRDRRGQAVRPGADDDRVRHARSSLVLLGLAGS